MRLGAPGPLRVEAMPILGDHVFTPPTLIGWPTWEEQMLEEHVGQLATQLRVVVTRLDRLEARTWTARYRRAWAWVQSRLRW
jgi:hypothetical protein